MPFVVGTLGGFALWAALRSFWVRLASDPPGVKLLSWREWRALRARGLGTPFWPWQRR